MSEVRKSRRARSDLLEIWAFVAIDDDTAADALLDRIEAKLQSLADFPGIGTPQASLGSDIRSVVVGKYVLLYRPVVNGIELVRAFHGARDIEGAFRS